METVGVLGAEHKTLPADFDTAIFNSRLAKQILTRKCMQSPALRGPERGKRHHIQLSDRLDAG